MMTGISVIIPSYNREPFLERALVSIGRQTLSCNEIIVVDDGSNDDTCACVQRFAKASDEIQVKYICQSNQGPAAARNLGIKEASGSHIAFLDSDDHWQKKKLAIQYAAMKAHPDIFISHTREKWFRRGKHLNQKKIHQPGAGDIFQHCLQLCAVGMSTVMVRRELFEIAGVFNEKLRCCEDYDLWLRVSSRHQFLLVEQALTIKEGGREDQVSYQFRVGMDKLRIGAILDLLAQDFLSIKQVQYSLEELKRKCIVYGTGCMRHRKSGEGQAYLDIGLWAENAINDNPATLIPIPKDPQL